MVSQAPQPKLLTVWRIRLLGIACIPSLLCGLFLLYSPFWWGVFTLVWAIVLLFFYYLYLPLRFQRLKWELADGWLILRCGVLYQRHRAVPILNIQFLSSKTPPLMRVMGLTTLQMHCAGGMLTLPGMSREQLAKLLPLLGEEGRLL